MQHLVAQYSICATLNSTTTTIAMPTSTTATNSI